MGRNSHYFENREERANHAKIVMEENAKYLMDVIQYSVDHRNYYTNLLDSISKQWLIRYKEGDVKSIPMYVVDADSVSALLHMDNILLQGESRHNPCILNFSSYTNPGGMFIKGSSAQEESLCHESTLYNTLSNETIVKEFYKVNAGDKNRHLYGNSSLYTPNVMFKRLEQGKLLIEYANVITCAAPNAHAAQKYAGVTKAEIREALIGRIFCVLYHAMLNSNDVLILGAYGCGVFGNDPFEVAFIFKELLQTCFFKYFSAIIFAVPNSGKSAINYQTFKTVIEDQKYHQMSDRIEDDIDKLKITFKEENHE